MSLLDRRLLIVTGKGGTGKTTIAVGLARLAAAQGKRVLLCDTDASGDAGAAFGIEDYGYTPTEVSPSLFLMQMDTEQALREYLELNLKLPFVAKIGSLARAFDFIATAAPGVREILVVGKLAWEVKRDNYDLVVVDASATGHVVAQLRAADSIGDLVSSGPLTGQTAWMKEMLGDPERTAAVIVTLPEELPVSETLELAQQLQTNTRVHLDTVVVNRVLPELFTRDDAVRFGTMRNAASADERALYDSAELARTMRAAQVEHLARLDRELNVGRVFVPQIFGPGDAAAITDDIFDSLSEELE